MKRPFSSKRPFGPFVSNNRFTDKGFDEDGKEVLGSHGTPYPNYSKEDLRVIYVLEGDHIAFTRKFVDELKRTLESHEGPENYRVEFLKSGPSAAKGFEEQAVMITVPGEELAVTDNQLDTVGGIIVRTATTVHAEIEIKERIYELEGTPS